MPVVIVLFIKQKPAPVDAVQLPVSRLTRARLDVMKSMNLSSAFDELDTVKEIPQWFCEIKKKLSIYFIFITIECLLVSLLRLKTNGLDSLTNTVSVRSQT